jgi:hypothetical protein
LFFSLSLSLSLSFSSFSPLPFLWQLLSITIPMEIFTWKSIFGLMRPGRLLRSF